MRLNSWQTHSIEIVKFINEIYVITSDSGQFIAIYLSQQSNIITIEMVKKKLKNSQKQSTSKDMFGTNCCDLIL